MSKKVADLCACEWKANIETHSLTCAPEESECGKSFQVLKLWLTWCSSKIRPPLQFLGFPLQLVLLHLGKAKQQVCVWSFISPFTHQRPRRAAKALSVLVCLFQHAGCVHGVLSAPCNCPQLAFKSRWTLRSKGITCLSPRQHDTLSSAHVVHFLSRSMRPHFQMRSGSQFHPLQKGQELLKVLNSNVMESDGPRLKKEAVRIGH